METATTGRKRVTFKVNAAPGSTVAVAGEFNSWDTSKKPLKDKSGNGNFEAIAMLPKGRYEYKVVINDVWSVDPDCDDWAYNPYGSLNSVIIVG